jgi:hypothetical protein
MAHTPQGHPTEGNRVTKTIAAAVAAIGILAPTAHTEPRPDRPPTPLTKRIDRARAKTHACQQQLGLDRTPVSTSPIYGARYARWVLALWRARSEAYCTLSRQLGNPEIAIRVVFGAHANEALTVARCESGLSTRASNGQYQGLFQMGGYARSRYGHSDTAVGQARAAHRYYMDAGWSPWQCSPSGGLQW